MLRSRAVVLSIVMLAFLVAPTGAATVPQAPSVPHAQQLPQVPLPQIPNNLPIGAPAITAPRAGATVMSPIVVKGTAANSAKVHVTATLALAAAVPVNGLSRKLAEADATADAKGTWQASLPYTLPATTAALKVVVEAVVLNALTSQKSSAATVEVTPR